MTATFTGLPPREKPEVSARDLSSQLNERTKGMKEAGDRATEEPFAALRKTGSCVTGCSPVAPTGVSTAPIKAAAEAFLTSLGPRRNEAIFEVESDKWRRWSNVHMFLMRHGVSHGGHDDAPARRRLAAHARVAQRGWLRDGAQHHEAQRDDP